MYAVLDFGDNATKLAAAGDSLAAFHKHAARSLILGCIFVTVCLEPAALSVTNNNNSVANFRPATGPWCDSRLSVLVQFNSPLRCNVFIQTNCWPDHGMCNMRQGAHQCCLVPDGRPAALKAGAFVDKHRCRWHIAFVLAPSPASGDEPDKMKAAHRSPPCGDEPYRHSEAAPFPTMWGFHEQARGFGWLELDLAVAPTPSLPAPAPSG